MKRLLKEQNQKISPQEFAALLRKKYPGYYDNISDIELTKLFLKKYPQYGNVVNLSNTDNSSTTQTPIKADVDTGVKNVSSSFSCIVKNTYWSGRIQTTTDPNHIFYKLPGNQEYNFYADGSFIYKDIPPYRTNIKGTWVCDGSSDFVINMEDDSRFESKIGKWKENVSAQPVTDLKEKSEKRRGTYLKIGDKNPKVGELQKCLIDKGFKNISKDGHIDNKFGMRTKQSVMDFQSKNGLKVSGVVDKKTWELIGGTSTLEEQKIIRKIVHQNLKSLIK